MADAKVTLQELKERMALFVRERDWEQFHSPKNLSMSIAIEAGELMEHFQWLSVEDSNKPGAEALHDIGEELADIVIYAISMANCLDLDLSDTILNKMTKNMRKYPKEKVKGKSHKYTWYRDNEDGEP